MLILAKAIKGSEFMYDSKSAHSVSKRSAKKIMDVLNHENVRWTLKENQIWHIYEVDIYDRAYDFAVTQKFTIRNGIVKHVAERRAI